MSSFPPADLDSPPPEIVYRSYSLIYPRGDLSPTSVIPPNKSSSVVHFFLNVLTEPWECALEDAVHLS